METNYEKRGYLLDDFRLFHLKDKNGTNIDYHYHEFCKLLLLRSRDKLLRMVLVLSNRQPPILKFRLGFAVKLTNANSLCLCKGSFSISWAYMIEMWMKNTRYCLNKLKVMI